MLTDFERGFLLGSLRPRPRQVLAMLANGYSRQEIREELHISYGTLRTHLSTIYQTLGTTNHVRLALMYHGIPLHKWREKFGDFAVATPRTRD